MAAALPVEPYEEDDWKRWQAAAQQIADQARKCVEILVCIDGECTQLQQVCPAEGESNGEETDGSAGG